MSVNLLFNQMQSLTASADHNLQINRSQQAKQEYVAALNIVNSIKSSGNITYKNLMPSVEDHIQKQIKLCDFTNQPSRPYTPPYTQNNSFPVLPPPPPPPHTLPSPPPPTGKNLDDIWNKGIKYMNNGTKDLEDNAIAVGIESLKIAKECFEQLKCYSAYSKSFEYIATIDRILQKYDFTEITDKMRTTSGKGDEYFKLHEYKFAKIEYEKCLDYYREIEANSSKMQKYLYEDMKNIYNKVTKNLKICISKYKPENSCLPPQSPVISHFHHFNVVSAQEWKNLDEYFAELENCFLYRNKKRALECLEILQTKIYKLSNKKLTEDERKRLNVYNDCFKAKENKYNIEYNY